MPKLAKNAALAKLRALLGPKFCYRINTLSVLPSQRPDAKEVAAAREAAEAAKKDCIARELWLKANDPEYQRLLAAQKAAEALHLDLRAKLCTRGITVGTGGSLFFCVEAEGDTWDEVVALVEKKKPTSQPKGKA